MLVHLQLEGKRGNRLLLRHISWPHRVGQCFAVTFWPLTWFVGCHFPIQSLLTFVWPQSTTFPNFQRGTATYLLVTLDWLLTLPSGRHVNATFNLLFQVGKASLVSHLPPSLNSSFFESYARHSHWKHSQTPYSFHSRVFWMFNKWCFTGLSSRLPKRHCVSRHCLPYTYLPQYCPPNDCLYVGNLS